MEAAAAAGVGYVSGILPAACHFLLHRSCVCRNGIERRASEPEELENLFPY